MTSLNQFWKPTKRTRPKRAPWQRQELFDSGLRASANGLGHHENPYADNTDQQVWWHAGWMTGETAKRDAHLTPDRDTII